MTVNLRHLCASAALVLLLGACGSKEAPKPAASAAAPAIFCFWVRLLKLSMIL